MDITKKQVIKYAVLPGIIPRIQSLFGAGMANIALLIAFVFNAARILPNTHPYLQRKNFKTYSTRQVIAEAANHIVFSRKNTDQIIIFFTVIAGLILFVFQFVVLIANIIVTQAKAQVALPTTSSGFFVTAAPEEDIAFRLLDLVFGVPNFFNSKEIANATGFHAALQDMLQFYSYGILIVSAMIIVYLIVAIVAETAQSGTPFGQRFNHTWVAPRLLIFFALLLPITSGLNGGQLLVLGSAKIGSSMATNGWLYFIDNIESYSSTVGGDQNSLIATPETNLTQIKEIPPFMLVAKTCEWAYSRTGKPIRAFIVWGEGANEFEQLPNMSGGVASWPATATSPPPPTSQCTLGSPCTFQDYGVSSGGEDLKIVFGQYDPATYLAYPNGVEPTCGSIKIPVTDVSEPGSAVIQTAFLNLIKEIWFTNNPVTGSGGIGTSAFENIDFMASAYTYAYLPIQPNIPPSSLSAAISMNGVRVHNWGKELECRFLYGGSYIPSIGTCSIFTGGGLIDNAVTAQLAANKFLVDAELRSYGWGGAGIWYNKIAQQNGALTSAAQGVPYIDKYPLIMEQIARAKLDEDGNVSPEDRFTPNVLGENFDRELMSYSIASTLNRAYLVGIENGPEQESTGNFIFDALNVALGTQGLFNMCENADIHPLAQLSSVGRSLINSSIAAAGFTILTTLFGTINSDVSSVTFAFSKFFATIMSVGFMIGFILFYVVPFLPFLYFFFAVGGWVKGIFEAIVAVPLWAIGHLRIDGDGIVGEQGLQGYILLFEIFFRPILIVFGLIAAISIFAAMAKVLNEIFYIVISNLAGMEDVSACGVSSITSAPIGSAEWMRGPVDEFFYTLLYAVIIYMIGLSCFKLIDGIPNKMLRWLGAEISAFNDSNEDAAGGLLTYVAMGGGQFGSQIGGGLSNIGQSIQARPAPQAPAPE
ncbi:MAG: DotA/TraY family protein [Alphaproteobacteria bacterium]|nr:DotA/TraY family protein [Alphaproteobacteria bacterium]NCQ88618.1 DotA/TraY family protein [Alphaproteobacteria bacterium]NCT06161.1 DotA/TraY family protein [Alphaproteobacteria bacterium]